MDACCAELPESLWQIRRKQPLLDKMVNDLSVNLVMHVMRKKASTRENYAGIPEILHEFYNECKSVDPGLPNWTKLPALPNADDKSAGATSSSATSMREIRLDGLIPDSELQRRGWGLDAKLQFADPCEERAVFTVVALDPALKNVTLQYKASPNDDADEDGESLVVDRADLSYMYKTHKLAALQVCFLFMFNYVNFLLPSFKNQHTLHTR